jgi:hypothetical protein
VQLQAGAPLKSALGPSRAVVAEIAPEDAGDKQLLIRPEDLEEALEEMPGSSQ